MNEREIFSAALGQPTEAERQAFLDKACDGAMRQRIERLLREQARLGSFLDHPPLESSAMTSGDREATQMHQHEDGSVDDTQIVDRGLGERPREDDTLRLSSQDSDDEISLGFLQAPTRPNSLGRLGHYDVLNVVGKGAFGTVLRAFDTKLERIVAIKVLAPEIAATSPARKRFLREARTSAQIRHENVVGIYSVEDSPIPYLVMEYIPGKTLQQRLDEQGPLDLQTVLRLGRQIADGLAAAHAQDLIHRDIKPGNILLEGGIQERVKITDFGLARTVDDASMTQSGMIAGTPMYMAPEQAHGHKLDQRADLFSLGSVLYQMLSGRPPFRASTTVAVLKRVAEDTARPIQEIIPEVPAWMCTLIGNLHAKNPDERYGSAREVSELLAQCAVDLRAGRVPTIPAPHTPGRSPDGTPVNAHQGVTSHHHESRQRSSLARIAAALLLLIGVLGITEATGMTNFAATVIRLTTGSGTLVIETDDPGVNIAIDGEEVTITGAGVEELTLRPGQYAVTAVKDGKPVNQELVSITRNGRTVVRVGIEQPPAPSTPSLTDTDVGRIAALPTEQQIDEFRRELKLRNPGCTGEIQFFVEDGLGELTIRMEGIRDLSPIRAFKQLGYFECTSRSLQDLSHLRGMRVKRLSVRGTSVRDLTPLKDVEGLTSLELTACMQLSDLTPLKDTGLQHLEMAFTSLPDLSALKGLPLQGLNLEGATVSDLSPLAGMQLKRINYLGSNVKDITVLKSMPLIEVGCDFQPARDASILRAIETLETINGKPVAEFWKQVDSDSSSQPAP